MGIVVIRVFIVLEVVKGDETYFAPSFLTLFPPRGGREKGRDKNIQRRIKTYRQGKGKDDGFARVVRHLFHLDRNKNGLQKFGRGSVSAFGRRYRLESDSNSCNKPVL